MSIAASVESSQFQAETRQLRNLMIHSLYKEREIFLRGWNSNAPAATKYLKSDL